MSAFWNKTKKEEEKKSGDDRVSSDGEKKLDDKDKSQNKPAEKKKDSKKSDEKKLAKKSKGKRVKPVNFEEKAQLISRTIIRPVISEDAMTKEALSKYVFIVDKNASKNAVKQAIEARYGIAVSKVNIINYKPKTASFRYRKGLKKGFKKAVVTIEAGKKIELFSTK